MKPKAAVPLKRIIGVGLLREEDKKRFKKLDKASDIIFKVAEYRVDGFVGCVSKEVYGREEGLCT
jgi:hypothetical protein